MQYCPGVPEGHKSPEEHFFDAHAPFHWNKSDVLRIMRDYALSAQPRWIPVNERLPNPHKSISDYPLLVVSTFFSQPVKGWFFGEDFFGDGDTNWRIEGVNGAVTVTHWQKMPALPDAPEGDQS